MGTNHKQTRKNENKIWVDDFMCWFPFGAGDMKNDDGLLWVHVRQRFWRTVMRLAD